MDSLALLRARSAELRLGEDEVASWAELLDTQFVQAVLSTLLQYEEALTELAQ